VNRGHDRCLDQTRKDQWQEVEMIVDEIERSRAFEEFCGMKGLPDLRVDAAIFLVPPRAHGDEARRRHRITGCKERHVGATRHKAFGQQRDHLLPGTVVAWGRPPGDRGEHANSHR
jgi:hypothetical protein